jgi:hypothetical protein
MARREPRSDRPGVHERVEGWVDENTETDSGQPKYLEGSDRQPTVDELRSQQQEEMAQSWTGPGFGVTTDAQWKGFLVGSLVGGLVGAVLLLPLAFISWGDLELGWRLLIAAVIGALAGGTVGALYLGGRLPELENETMDADGRPQIGSTPRDRRNDERGR